MQIDASGAVNEAKLKRQEEVRARLRAGAACKLFLPCMLASLHAQYSCIKQGQSIRTKDRPANQESITQPRRPLRPFVPGNLLFCLQGLNGPA